MENKFYLLSVASPFVAIFDRSSVKFSSQMSTLWSAKPSSNVIWFLGEKPLVNYGRLGLELNWRQRNLVWYLYCVCFYVSSQARRIQCTHKCPPRINFTREMHAARAQIESGGWVGSKLVWSQVVYAQLCRVTLPWLYRARPFTNRSDRITLSVLD